MHKRKRYVPSVPCPEAAEVPMQKERDLIELARKGNMQAQNELLSIHLPCIERLAKAVSALCPYMPMDELCQEGLLVFNFGTWARGYDLNRGWRLWPYAREVIRDKMMKACQREYEKQRNIKNIDPPPPPHHMQFADFSLDDVADCLGPEDGPKWIVLFLLQEEMDCTWRDIENLLLNCREDAVRGWLYACAYHCAPSTVPQTWLAACELFPPPARTEPNLKAWYSRQRRLKLEGCAQESFNYR